MHLRMCVLCDEVSCCYNLRIRMRASTSGLRAHPVARLIEPGEDGGCCGEDKMTVSQVAVIEREQLPPCMTL